MVEDQISSLAQKTSSMEEAEADWAILAALPLSLILDKLPEGIDHVWFSLVCKNWCSIAKLNHQDGKFRNSIMPMLMIPMNRKSRTKKSLYGIPSKRVYRFQLEVPCRRRTCGSSHGWIATVDPSYVITLLNPFKNVAPIVLPPIKRGDSHSNNKLYELNMHKVVLSTNPTKNPCHYVVVAIHSQRLSLAFMRAGQKFWTYIHDDHLCFNDVIFYRDRVFAINRWNEIVSFDLTYSNDSSGTEMIIPIIVSPRNSFNDVDGYAHRAYLVKSLEGDLWLVRKYIGFPDDDEDDEDNVPPSSGTICFKVYKLELDPQSGKLMQMLRLDSLGDNVLFVGDSDSISLSASYFSNCLQKDSIYFTDDFYEDMPFPYPNGPFDIGIYNVKDGGFSQHYPYKHSLKRMPPPVWVIPPFQWE